MRRSSSAQAKGLRHRNNAAQLLGGSVDNRTSFLSHVKVYSTAIPSASSPAIPGSQGLERQWGMSLADNMKAARKKSGKTQEQVAQEIGRATNNPTFTKGSVSQWETGGSVPELKSFRAWCVATGASADEVLLDKNPDPLLRQLIQIYVRLSPDGRDVVLGKANRVLSEEHPGPAPHNPGDGRLPPGSRPQQKSVKRPSRTR